MCGIVGILGTGPVAGSIVDALKRLEYRGYDSAGVATLENGRLERRRAEGKLKNLEAKLAAAPLGGTIGIGHTRWATHGKPTETNAHPHASPRLAVVHNGIIENFRALRQELAAKGYAFATETDSEIAAFVVEDELAKGKSPEAAVHAALGRLRGAFALVYLFEGEEDLLIGARQGAPLAIGYGDGEMYLGSDALALAPSPTASPISRKATGRRSPAKARRFATRAANASSAASSEARPAACSRKRATIGTSWPRRSTSSRRWSAIRSPATSTWAALKLKPFAWPADPRRLTRLSIVGCGTAYMAGLVAKYWIERLARLPVEIDVASEYRYREAPVDDGGLDHRHFAIGRDGGHAGVAALREGEGGEDGRRRQRARFQHRAPDRRRGADAGRPRDRRRLDQGLHLPARRAGGARDRPWQGARDDRRGRGVGARSASLSRRRVFSPRRSSSSPKPRSWRMWSPARGTCSISAAARPIRWRSKAR